MKKLFTVAILLAIGLTNLKAQDNQWYADKSDTLKVGDPAPPIVVRKWIKGNPVTNFKPGMVYVVEFWATWCGPCLAAMPHLSELAQKYKGKATVLSFDVKEDKKTDFLPRVERFVKYSGNRMSYTIAVDASGDVMEKTWLDAIGSRGIPEVFIIDQHGKIAWHGHPNYVDDVLEAVVSGQYDEAGKKKIEVAAQAKEERYNTLNKEMMSALKNGTYQEALTIVEDLMVIYPGMRNYFSNKKYEFLSHIDAAKAKQFAEALMVRLYPKDQVGFAIFILYAQPDGTYKPDYEFALTIIKQAAAHWDPQDKGILSLLAQANYKTGNKDEAVKNQGKYIEMLKKDQATNPKVLEMAEETLKRYKDM